MKVEEVKSSTFILVIAGIILFIALIICGSTLIKESSETKKEKKVNEFNEVLIDAAKIYMDKKEDDFNNFKEVGDINLITTDELITNGLINESIEVPTDKELKDYYVKAKKEEDGSISYVVVG
ncbi:MAG: hypothetical protein J6A17_02715 [Bacilli bacterium]|nr:hypothetical protein [Bacilli bacterium]